MGRKGRLWKEVESKETVREGQKSYSNMKQRKKRTYLNTLKWKWTTDSDREKKCKTLI